MATFEENIKNTLQKTLKSRQERDVTFYSPYNPKKMATFEKQIKNTIQKTLKARQERDVIFYPPYNP